MKTNHTLKYAPLAPAIWGKLATIPRTGWVDRGVKNPETVQQHTLALIDIAQSFDGKIAPKERDELFGMLEIHDWPEAVVGDTRIVANTEIEYRILRAQKFEREFDALTDICAKLGYVGEEIMTLWLRFENAPDIVAVFARQLDKYQAVEQALAYELTQGIKLF